MPNIEEVLKEQVNNCSPKEKIIVSFKHNLLVKDQQFITSFIQVIDEEVLNVCFNSTAFSKDIIEIILENSVKKEEQMLLLLKEAFVLLKNLEQKYLHITYVNSFLVLEAFYDNILFMNEFSENFYKELVKYLREYFNVKMSILFMNINSYLCLKLNTYNEILLNYPPTKKIKQLRLIEYVQNYILIIERINKKEALSIDTIKEYGYMLKVLKNNRKELLTIENLEFDLKDNFKISFVEEEVFLALKKALNPNNHEKIEIINQDKYSDYLVIAKQLLTDYNKVNGIKTKKRKKGVSNV